MDRMMMMPFYDVDPMYDMFGNMMSDMFPIASSGFSRLPSYMMPGMGGMGAGGMGMGMLGWPSSSMGMGGMNWPALAGPSGPPLAQFTDRGMARVVNDKHQFAVNVDVHQFKPEEIKVKTTDDFVTIEGNHEERDDPHGYIKRHFIRRYAIPENVKAENITSTLSSDGVLTVKAPKERKMIEGGEEGQAEHEVPIQRSAFPAIATAAQRARGRHQQQEGQQGQQEQQAMEQGGEQQGQQAKGRDVPVEKKQQKQ